MYPVNRKVPFTLCLIPQSNLLKHSVVRIKLPESQSHLENLKKFAPWEISPVYGIYVSFFDMESVFKIGLDAMIFQQNRDKLLC